MLPMALAFGIEEVRSNVAAAERTNPRLFGPSGSVAARCSAGVRSELDGNGVTG